MYIIMYNKIMKTLSLSEMRANLPTLVDAVDQRFERVTVTRSGKAKAVLMSSDEFDGWLETIDILSNPGAVAALQEAEKDLAAGRVTAKPQAKKTR